MDFRVPGLPHSVVKHAQSTSVGQLIQKIENHPDRHALQQDLRQNQSFNPVSSESKPTPATSKKIKITPHTLAQALQDPKVPLAHAECTVCSLCFGFVVDSLLRLSQPWSHAAQGMAQRAVGPGLVEDPYWSSPTISPMATAQSESTQPVSRRSEWWGAST